MLCKQYFANAGIRQHPVVNRIEAMKNANGMREMTVDGWVAELSTRFRASVEQSLRADRLPCLSRPFPVSNFFFVDPFGVCIVNARDDLTLQPFLDVGAHGTQTWDTIDDVDCQTATSSRSANILKSPSTGSPTVVNLISHLSTLNFRQGALHKMDRDRTFSNG